MRFDRIQLAINEINELYGEARSQDHI